MITIFDSAVQKLCPLYLGNTIKVHEGYANPLHLELSKEEKL